MIVFVDQCLNSDLMGKVVPVLLWGRVGRPWGQSGFQQASISRRGPGAAALALQVGNEFRFPPQEGTQEMLLMGLCLRLDKIFTSPQYSTCLRLSHGMNPLC